MSNGLRAFALHWAFQGHLQFHRHKQATEFGEPSHLIHLLCDSLYTNVHEFQFLPHDGLSHISTHIPYQKQQSLRSFVSVNLCKRTPSHTSRVRNELTAARIPVSCLKYDLQIVAIYLRLQAARAGKQQTDLVATGVAKA
jgi:hypothetical protein